MTKSKLKIHNVTKKYIIKYYAQDSVALVLLPCISTKYCLSKMLISVLLTLKIPSCLSFAGSNSRYPIHYKNVEKSTHLVIKLGVISLVCTALFQIMKNISF